MLRHWKKFFLDPPTFPQKMHCKRLFHGIFFYNFNRLKKVDFYDFSHKRHLWLDKTAHYFLRKKKSSISGRETKVSPTFSTAL